MPDTNTDSNGAAHKTSALSEETQKARRSLIAVAALLGALVYLEIAPTKISFLGIDFEQSKVASTVLLAFVVEYLWVSFLIYGLRDWRAWWIRGVSGIEGHLFNIRRRDEANRNMDEAIRAAMASDPPAAKFKTKWPDNTQEQEFTLDIVDSPGGVKHWKKHARQMKWELFYFSADTAFRTAWEFLLPFGCGAATTIWLVMQI